jgi:hypothetical protein
MPCNYLRFKTPMKPLKLMKSIAVARLLQNKYGCNQFSRHKLLSSVMFWPQRSALLYIPTVFCNLVASTDVAYSMLFGMGGRWMTLPVLEGVFRQWTITLADFDCLLGPHLQSDGSQPSDRPSAEVSSTSS